MTVMESIRDVHAGDYDAILALNAESVRFLSPLDRARLKLLDRQSCYHRGVERDGRIAAFLLAFAQDAGYDSANYRWFAARYPEFVYVDRVVVSAELQGQGIGKLLYDDVIAFARSRAAPVVVCEFDLEPPNPGSRAFHERFGFREVGTQVANGKTVSLQEKTL
jgi:predicted GNAT superfamily acetyltransferase